jgi:hypothetical protein
MKNEIKVQELIDSIIYDDIEVKNIFKLQYNYVDNQLELSQYLIKI